MRYKKQHQYLLGTDINLAVSARKSPTYVGYACVEDWGFETGACYVVLFCSRMYKNKKVASAEERGQFGVTGDLGRKGESITNATHVLVSAIMSNIGLRESHSDVGISIMESNMLPFFTGF